MDTYAADETVRADQLAREGLSVLAISRELGEEFSSLAMYERDALARKAFDCEERNHYGIRHTGEAWAVVDNGTGRVVQTAATFEEAQAMRRNR
jgi:hypothetical protein